jgi:hypothetical protein
MKPIQPEVSQPDQEAPVDLTAEELDRVGGGRVGGGGTGAMVTD